MQTLSDISISSYWSPDEPRGVPRSLLRCASVTTGSEMFSSTLVISFLNHELLRNVLFSFWMFGFKHLIIIDF